MGLSFVSFGLALAIILLMIVQSQVRRTAMDGPMMGAAQAAAPVSSQSFTAKTASGVDVRVDLRCGDHDLSAEVRDVLSAALREHFSLVRIRKEDD